MASDLTVPSDGPSLIPDARAMRVESVPDCDLCGCRGVVLHRHLSDLLETAPGTYSIRQCADRDCGTLWLDPRPIADDLHIAYQTYFTHTDPDQNVPTSTSSSWRRSARQVWLDLVGVSRQREYTDLVGLNAVVPGNVLDIGCGNGMRLARLRALGWNVVGQEVDPHAASIAINSLGIPVFVGLLHEAGFADDCFDAVISNHVLEHVLDPAAFLAETYRVLKPGGLLVAVTPNARSLGHRVFGRYWMGLDPPRHIRICSPTSLSRLASNAAIDAPKVWTTAANAEAFAKTGLLIRHNSKIGARGYSPSGVGRLVGAMVFATAAQFYHRVRPDSGEECVLWAQKPPV